MKEEQSLVLDENKCFFASLTKCSLKYGTAIHFWLFTIGNRNKGFSDTIKESLLVPQRTNSQQFLKENI